MSIGKKYPLTTRSETRDETVIKRFYFESVGTKTIDKAVEYQKLQQISGRNLYNLGFGDYNSESDEIEDKVESENGDAYTVFNTVLSTIETFFSTNPTDVIYVEGSDSGDAAEAVCRTTCQRKCEEKCRKADRRIKIYKNYIDKNFDVLSFNYGFLGRRTNDGPAEPYDKEVKYVALLVYKKG